MANDGIARKIGDKNKDRPNKTAVVTAVNPVRPPSATPEELSTNVVVVEVPSTAPAVVPTASARSAPLILGSFPSLSSIFALEETPIKVPSVSNKSTNKNANTITTNSRIGTPSKLNFAKIGERLGMLIPALKSGSSE